MKMSLNGSGWEADYFLSETQYNQWRSRSRNLENMLLDWAVSAGFVQGNDAPGAMSGTIPGCDRSFLLENNLIEDPFFGRNLDHSSWAEKYSWAFRKRFSLPEAWRNSRIRIDFAGLDYEAVIFLNGQWIGTHQGMFMPVGFDITDLVRFDDDNLIALVFLPAPQGKPNHHDVEPADFAKFHRTPMGFGWDWSRKIVPTGIWDDVSVSAYEKCRVRDWHFTARGNTGCVKLEIESRFEQQLPVSLRFIPYNFEGKSASCEKLVALRSGTNQVHLQCTVDELREWQVNGYGFPALYTLEIELDHEQTGGRVGFRTIAMRRNPDSPQDAYDQTFVINGTPIFARGVNWVPADLLASRVTTEDYEHLVALAADAGINLFRMWGGGQIEKSAFYDACDRHGIMVWQEFMHACSNAPKDAAFIAVKRREAEAILRKLRNHVSLSLLCGGNEMQYYGEIHDSPMLQMYGSLAQQMAPGPAFHTSSPDLSRPGERGHGPWNWREHREYNGHFRLLASEIGCNAMPEYDSLERFIPQKELQTGRGPALNYHFYNRINAHDLGMPLQFFAPGEMRQFCAESMFAQADAAQYIFEHYRRLFPRASGCFFWQYNEPWPTCSWSIVDYYGVPKMALYALKRANAPVLLSLEDDSWCCPDGTLAAKWFITCDQPCGGTAGLTALTVSGKKLFERSVTGSWNKETTLLMTLDEVLPQNEIVVLFSELNGQKNNVRLYGAPDFRTAFASPEATLRVNRSPGEVVIENTGKSVALHVRLRFAGLAPRSVRLSDNYLVLAPGEKTLVKASAATDEVDLRVSAWNFKEKTYALHRSSTKQSS